jgi:hypothetical protein
MSTSCSGVRCTAHDGAVWTHLDNERVKIPLSLLEESRIFTDALSSMADPSIAIDFTLAAPKEWLRAWMANYGSGEELLSNTDIEDLLSCLMARFYP